MDDILHLEKVMPRLFYTLRSFRRKIKLLKLRSLTIEEIMSKDSALFEERIGRPIDWHNIKSYNEKLQWEKLFHNDPVKSRLTDKYRVREWVEKKIGKQFLIPLIGVWENANNIDFEQLPNSFVLKTNCASGDAIIVKDKSTLTKKDIIRIKCKLNYYLHYDWGYHTFELHYSQIKPLIVCEDLLPTDDTDVPDYKFTCFHGQPYCCRVDIGRYHNHRRNTYDLEWNLMPWNAGTYMNTDYDFPKPENFEMMIKFAQTLSQGFRQVRVDFYNIEGKIYFGEMTFTSGSGLEPIFPVEMDYKLGELWKQERDLP